MIGYVTLEEAKKCIGERYDISAIDEENLKRALYLSLDKIESLAIRNSGRNENQPLLFPRKCEKAVPEEIKKAQILEAYSLSVGDTEALQDQEQGIGGRSINDMSINYTDKGDNKIGNVYFANAQARSILFRYARKIYDWS